MTQTDPSQDLRGHQVVDVDGDKIGKVDEIYLGEASGEPEWALVNTGLFGLKSSFVLITGARIEGDEITVPFPKSTVKDAPKIDPDGELTSDEEAALYAYYGREDYADVGSPEARQPNEEPVGPDEPERRGPLGPTGLADDEDPVPPDGEAPPASGDGSAPVGLAHLEGDQESSDDVPKPPGAPDGRQQPVGDVPKPAGAPDTSKVREHGIGHEHIPMEGGKATPESGPVVPASEQDELEAPESPDAPSPRTTSDDTGRSRMRKYIAAEGEDRSPDAPGPDPRT